jgi:hypothetical protein
LAIASQRASFAIPHSAVESLPTYEEQDSFNTEINDESLELTDETSNLLPVSDARDNAVTASNLAEAFNRVRRERGDEQLLLMPIASEAGSPQPEVQIKVNELIQTCPEISNG